VFLSHNITKAGQATLSITISLSIVVYYLNSLSRNSRQTYLLFHRRAHSSKNYNPRSFRVLARKVLRIKN